VALWASLSLLGRLGFQYQLLQDVQTIRIGSQSFDLSRTGAHITVGTFRAKETWARQLRRASNSLPESVKCDVKASHAQYEDTLIVRFSVCDHGAKFLVVCEDTVASGGWLPKGFKRRLISDQTFFGPVFHLSIWNPSYSPPTTAPDDVQISPPLP
jgi:hypothetical protein